MSLDKIKNLLDKNNFDFYFIETVDSTMSEIKKHINNRNICLNQILQYHNIKLKNRRKELEKMRRISKERRGKRRRLAWP